MWALLYLVGLPVGISFCSAGCCPSPNSRGGVVPFLGLWGLSPLLFVLGCLWGIALLEINS